MSEQEKQMNMVVILSEELGEKEEKIIQQEKEIKKLKTNVHEFCEISEIYKMFTEFILDGGDAGDEEEVIDMLDEGAYDTEMFIKSLFLICNIKSSDIYTENELIKKLNEGEDLYGGDEKADSDNFIDIAGAAAHTMNSRHKNDKGECLWLFQG